MKILFVSLGCDKNLVDSEVMLGLLYEAGYEITDDEEAADAAVVNTCCFINDAKEESINTIIELGERKKQGKLQAIVVTGCLAQRYEKEISKQLPEVDAIVGTTAYEEIVHVLKETLEGEHPHRIKSIDYLPEKNYHRIMTTGGYYSYLKIAEGCNKNCSYCIIPKVRGRFRSVPMEHIIETARELTEKGAAELILVAQETTLYGVDLYGEKKLPELLRRLCELPLLKWIRILYCYPEEITDELIQTIKTQKKICHYLDLPIQHCSDTILKRMGRRTTKAELMERIRRIREEIPDIALRTSLITGFPGETEAEHEELKEFIRQMRFERLGVFTYSPEEGTKAAQMENQIDEALKEKRREELMLLQQEIIEQRMEDYISVECEVMIEGSLPEEENVYVGRTYMDAPNVDGYIFVKARAGLMSGDIVKVLITDAREYDLIGELVPEE